MSAYTWPVLPGITPTIDRTPIYATDVYYTISGKRQTVSWESAPRYRYRLTYEFLRDNVNAPAPLAAYSELGAIVAILDACRGEWDTFTFVDPHDGVSRTCSLSESEPTVTKIADHHFAASLEFESQK